ncbi:TonB-linked outer membrane protein, SusC/RagA family [bacterium A37T11]|nr:TonB-linked outer membrane protein, SusC/RagA family [bacterium A37T11]
MKTLLCLSWLIISAVCTVSAQSITGRVFTTGENGKTIPLVGASITFKNSRINSHSDQQGYFKLPAISTADSLRVSFVGYVTSILFVKPGTQNIRISLVPESGELQVVEVNTGYYSVPKERATGSFTHIDNELLNRSVSTNLLERLEGVTNGLQFDRRSITGEGISAEPELRVRGLSTIESNSRPLIIVDNFPYEGELSSINPNDVYDVTILKDAAAASIWGARAGNGVIVITTKKGSFNQPAKVSVTSNVTIKQKPDLFYNQNVLPSATMMDIQQELYERGAYAENPQTPIPLYVELLIKQRDGKISESDFDSQKALMQQTDIRDQALQYLYQPAINKQYALNISGGGKVYNYYLSAGYDRVRAQLVGVQDRRINVSMQNSFKVRPNLELTGGVWYTNQQQQNNGVASVGWDTRNPYARLADDNGNALPTVKKYRMAYLETAEELGLLDWMYRPLDELNLKDNQATNNQLRLNGSFNYSFLSHFRLAASYQYVMERLDSRIVYDKDSYYVRNLINGLTQSNGTWIIPLGGILKEGTTDEGSAGDSRSHSGRVQVNYQQTFSKLHDVNVLAGAEISQNITRTLPGNVFYAYDESIDYGLNSLTFGNTAYKARPNGYAVVPTYGSAPSYRTKNRNLSYFSNASYAYNQKYILSGSARWDGSNLLGVKTNQRGTSLWSVGGSWELSKEDFYVLKKGLPYLRLRATYGSAGNIDKSQSYYPTIRTDMDEVTLLPVSILVSPGNPSLRWEQVNTMNFGVDWKTAVNRISGSIEYFNKASKYLLGNRLKDPTIGLGIYDNFKENYGDMETNGVDVEVHSVNLKGTFRWETNLLLNYSNNKITKIDDQPFTTSVDNYFWDIGVLHPVKGRSLDEIYDLPWYGLNPNTGQPLIYMNGEISNDYQAYYASLKPDDLVMAGLSVAPWYGSVRNIFEWKNIQLDFLITFKAGHIFQRSSMPSGGEYITGTSKVHMDYFERWQKPGDEKYTNVPSRTDTYEEQRAWVYQYTTALITPADVIRLQDINLSYTFKHRVPGLPFQNLKVFVYSRNLAILWRANKQGIDPDYPHASYPAPKSFSIGLQTNL